MNITYVFAFLLFSSCVSTPKQSRNALYTDQSFSVDSTECFAEGAPSKKSLIILPPTGGTNLIDRSYAKRFCESGWNVYLLNDWSNSDSPGTDLGKHQRNYESSQHAIRLTLQRIKTPFIGILGTSLGATYVSVAANTFPEIDAAFMIVGGLPLSRVIVTSDQEKMTKLRKERFETMKFADNAAYESALDKNIALEPTRLGDLHKSKTIGVVIATQDTTVPTETQKNLVDFFKPATVIERSSSHFWAIVKTWLFDGGRLVDFFDAAANAKSAKPTAD